ncbi:hypothetical protein [Haloechinothrix alba]|nr:hypothetical protein [Haloechinothrix alba]
MDHETEGSGRVRQRRQEASATDFGGYRMAGASAGLVSLRAVVRVNPVA